MIDQPGVTTIPAMREIRSAHSRELRDDMVVKALSWALRELSKRDPAAAAAFIRKYDARLAARVRREVTAKLETGRKRR